MIFVMSHSPTQSVCLHVNTATGQLIGFFEKFYKLLDLALLPLPTVMGF